MAGIKGRSGRKTKIREVEDGALLKISSHILMSYMANSKTPEKDRVRIALEVFKKLSAPPKPADPIIKFEVGLPEGECVEDFE